MFCVRVIYTLYTALLHEQTNVNSDKAIKMLASMTHDDKKITQNQFLYKALLINTMMAMHGANQSEERADQILKTLQGVFMAQIGYAEGERNHPFLEEVISLLATYFETIVDYRNALYMWHHFLGIQERMFGEDKKEMITTFKKIATLHS